MKTINGNDLSTQLKTVLSQTINEKNYKPTLLLARVGNDPASEIYVRNKIKACDSVGIHSIVMHYNDTISNTELLNNLMSFVNDEDINGILVQLPLPAHIDEAAVMDVIGTKDVDGFSVESLGALLSRRETIHACTPKGIMTLLKSTNVNLSGLDAIVIGQSNIVGRPVAIELLNAGCTVTICHSRTKNLKNKVKQADIVVVAIGKPEFITGDYIKEGAIVIDVGINRTEEGKLVGDVEFDSASKKASFITPVPKGVGPMTVYSLLENTVELYKRQNNLD